MIRTFADEPTRDLFVMGANRHFPADVCTRAVRKLERINAASSLSDLVHPHGNRLHPLKGDRAGQHSISVNRKWRICFRFTDGDAYEVELCDYH